MTRDKKNLVLIVDDSLEILQILGEILGKNGYLTAFASSGTEALEFVSQEKPDLILLDIMMPGKSGIEVCEEIKKNVELENIPIIFISALAHSDDKLNGFRVGGADYISKPFNRDEVLARVKTHVEMKNLLEENIIQKRELEKMNASKDTFFSIISHDLRSLVGGILGVSKLLARKVEKDNIKEFEVFGERLVQSSTKLYTLLENLLEWANIQKDGMKYVPVECSIKEIIDESIMAVSENANIKNIEIKDDIEDMLVSVDKNMIVTVIRNLLSNAVKFTKYDGCVTIDCEKIEHSKNADSKVKILKINVSDNGVGMDKNTLDKVFDITTKTTSLGTSQEEGSGLGLMLCKELIEINGGKIFVESEVGVGTTVSFTVPLV